MNIPILNDYIPVLGGPSYLACSVIAITEEGLHFAIEVLQDLATGGHFERLLALILVRTTRILCKVGGRSCQTYCSIRLGNSEIA